VSRRVLSSALAWAKVLAFCGEMLAATQNMGPFPKDILRLILMLVDSYDDLHRCQLTCRTWRALIVDNAMFDRLDAEERILDFNDWGDGVRPSQVTAEMVGKVSLFAEGEVKVCVIGDGGAGKTCLTLRYVQDIFAHDYDPTIQDCYRKQSSLYGATLDILDTAGADGCEGLAPLQQWMHACDAIVLCIDVSPRGATDVLDYARQTLTIQRLRGSKHDYHESDAGLLGRPILVVATKCDLPPVISSKVLTAFAKAQKAGLIFTSAKNDTRVRQAFEECVRYAAARRLNELSKDPKKTGCVLM
jgi:small GTP-binding protein